MNRLKQLIERDQWAELLTASQNINQHSKNSEIEILAFSEESAIKKAVNIFGVAPEFLEYKQISKGSSQLMGWFKIPSRYVFSVHKIIADELVEGIDYNHYNELGQNKNGSFRLHMYSQGLELCIFPPTGLGKHISSTDIINELHKRGIENINTPLISKALQNIGTPIIISPYVKSEENSTFTISIGKNEMTAKMTFTNPGITGRFPTIQEVSDELTLLGINYGINKKAIQDAFDNALYNTPITIAQGTEMIQGTNGSIEYHFAIGKDNLAHAMRQDGSINFKELNIIHNVYKDDIVATRHLETQGENGFTVTGDEIVATHGTAIDWNLGDNVILSSNGIHAIAANAGQVYLKSNQICVEPVYEVSSNVDLSIGNIDFLGNVIIKGNVDDGFSVISGGNIEIHGHIGNCFIHAEGNIIAHQGIQGKDEATIECKGDLYAHFIERANISIGGDLIVTKALLHSKVIGEQGIYVIGGKKSIIAGGNIKAKNEIYANQIGAESYIETHLEVGYSKKLDNKISILNSFIHEKEELLISMNNELSRLSTKLPVDKLIRFEQKIVALKNQISQRDNILHQKKSQLHNLQKVSRISAKKMFLPGVKVKIGNVFLDITIMQSSGTLIKNKENIVINAYSPSPLITQYSSQIDQPKRRKK